MIVENMHGTYLFGKCFRSLNLDYNFSQNQIFELILNMDNKLVSIICHLRHIYFHLFIELPMVCRVTS